MSNDQQYKAEVLGQFFTPPDIVASMLALRRNFGRVLEPAAGEGAFLSCLGHNAVGIELDRNLQVTAGQGLPVAARATRPTAACAIHAATHTRHSHRYSRHHSYHHLTRPLTPPLTPPLTRPLTLPGPSPPNYSTWTSSPTPPASGLTPLSATPLMYAFGTSGPPPNNSCQLRPLCFRA